jgi:hypothetical protein
LIQLVFGEAGLDFKVGQALLCVVWGAHAPIGPEILVQAVALEWNAGCHSLHWGPLH